MLIDQRKNGIPIAYITHDLGDALRAGLGGEDDLPAAARSLGSSSAERINSLVWDVVERSWAATGEVPSAAPEIAMSPSVVSAANALQAFSLTQKALVARFFGGC